MTVTSSNHKTLPPDRFSPGYRRYALGVLLVVYTFNFIDRQILAILAEPIKQDLGLSDTQLGFLTGFAFALFYATLGIPIARFADRSSRVNIISIALSVWSLMTALSGLAANFWQLAVARIGVGVGEAGCSPPAHSLISDFFSREERATAMAIYTTGVPLGTMFGFLAGGWINEFFGWRIAFFVVGVPGLLLALFVRFALREPPRGGMEKDNRPVAEAPPLGEVVRYLWAQKSFRHISLAASFAAFAGYGFVVWLPSFFIRYHGLGTGEIGTWLALLAGIASGLGTLAGGRLADYFAIRDTRAYVWIGGITLLASVPFFVAAFLVSSPGAAILLLIVPYFLNSFWVGPSFSMVQSLVPPQMRAVASSVFLFWINLIGLGLGPQLIGIASDLLRPSVGDDSLRYALIASVFVYLWACWHFARAGRTLAADLKLAER